MSKVIGSGYVIRYETGVESTDFVRSSSGEPRIFRLPSHAKSMLKQIGKFSHSRTIKMGTPRIMKVYLHLDTDKYYE